MTDKDRIAQLEEELRRVRADHMHPDQDSRGEVRRLIKDLAAVSRQRDKAIEACRLGDKDNTGPELLDYAAECTKDRPWLSRALKAKAQAEEEAIKFYEARDKYGE